ncbi:MAG: hypothetical protein K0S61_282 [Anaerocolumna sp.]|jgi:hypothetical protein|nr:hypothetical protein [Anaerocolumna sp.]
MKKKTNEKKNMKDKVLNRLIAIQHLDTYKDKIEQLRKNQNFTKLISINQDRCGDSIILYDSFFDMMILNIFDNLEFPESIDEGIITIDLQSMLLNIRMEIIEYFDFITNRITGVIPLDKKIEIVSEEKRELIMKNYSRDLKADLMLMLVEFTLVLITEFVTMDIYGVPSKEVLMTLMNDLLGNEREFIRIIPIVKRTIDPDFLALKLEHRFFKKIFKKYKIDVYNEMLKEGYYAKEICLQEMLKKNPKFAITINPYFTKTELKNDFGEDLYTQIENLKKLLELDISELNSSQETIEFLSWLYVDRRFNKKMSYVAIAQDINTYIYKLKESEITDLNKYERILLELDQDYDASKVWKAINNLAEQTGLD